jgi:hypothetical protein
MTTSTKPAEAAPPLFGRAAWARQQLGLSEDASRDDVLARYCTVLEEEDFVPYRSQAAAFELLSGQTDESALAEECLLAEEVACCDAVEEFSRRMLDLPVSEREAEIARLTQQCSHQPRALARLRQLGRLIRTRLPSQAETETDDAKSLIAAIGQILLAAPARRGEIRRQWLDTAATDSTRWARAAAAVRRDHASWAAADPWLLDALSQTYQRAEEAEHARALARLQPESAAASASSSSGSFAGIPWWAIVLGILALKAGIFSASRSSNSPKNYQPYSTPKFDYEKYRTQPTGQQRLDELMEQLRREREQREQLKKLPQFEEADLPDFRPAAPQPPHPTLNNNVESLLKHLHEEPEFPARSPEPGSLIPRKSAGTR